MVLSQLSIYLASNSLVCPSHSGHHPGHSTETVLLKVINGILLALDDGNVYLLTLLDISAEFNTVDHKSLLSRL